MSGPPAPAGVGLLEPVVELAHRYGSDPAFARGGGGNISTKAEGVLWIKPSGVALARLTADALMPLHMAQLLAMLALGDEGAAGSDPVLRVAMRARLRPTDDRRPSVECLFHALIPDRIVLHTHPTVVNAVTCAVRGRQIVGELLGDDALWVPYTDPGLPLARRIADERERFEAALGRAAPPVLFLQSHGLIVTGSTADEVVERSERTVEQVRQRVGSLEPPDAEGERASTASAGARSVDGIAAALSDLMSDGSQAVVAADRSALAAWIANTPDGQAFVRGGPLTPDQIVYAGSTPLLVTGDLPAEPGDVLRDELARHEGATGERPSTAVVAGVGVFAAGHTRALATTALEVYLDAARIAIGAARLGGVRPMTPDERRFIEGWEAEAYRRGIAAATGDAT